jgi:hypothetical protein
LASGPWTEARLRFATPQTVAVRRWIEYVGLLKDNATFDVDAWAEQLADAEIDLNAKSEQKRESVARARIGRSRARLAEMRRHRHATRKRLHLED